MEIEHSSYMHTLIRRPETILTSCLCSEKKPAYLLVAVIGQVPEIFCAQEDCAYEMHV